MRQLDLFLKPLLVMWTAVLLISCAGWKPVGETEGYPFKNFTLDIPPEWMQLKTDDHLLISKDGPFLQYVLAQQMVLEQPFQHTARAFTPRMLPQEAAEVVVHAISCDRGVLNFQLLENQPAVIDGQPGFQLVFTYRTRDGLTYKTRYYGFISGGFFYSIRYNAAQRHYFEKDLETFEKLVQSFHLTGSPST